MVFQKLIIIFVSLNYVISKTDFYEKNPPKYYQTEEIHGHEHTNRKSPLPPNYFRPFPKYVVTERPQDLWFDPNYIGNHRWKPKHIAYRQSSDFNSASNSNPNYGYQKKMPNKLIQRTGLPQGTHYSENQSLKQELDPYASILGPLGILSVVVAAISAVYLMITADTNSVTKSLQGTISRMGIDDIYELLEQSKSLVQRLTSSQIRTTPSSEKEKTKKTSKISKTRFRREANPTSRLSDLSKKHDKVLNYLTDILYNRLNQRVSQPNANKPKRQPKITSRKFDESPSFNNLHIEGEFKASKFQPNYKLRTDVLSNSYNSQFSPSPMVKSTEEDFRPIHNYPETKWPLEILQQKPPKLEGNFKPTTVTRLNNAKNPNKLTSKEIHSSYFDSRSHSFSPMKVKKPASDFDQEKYKNFPSSQVFSDFKVGQSMSVSSGGTNRVPSDDLVWGKSSSELIVPSITTYDSFIANKPLSFSVDSTIPEFSVSENTDFKKFDLRDKKLFQPSAPSFHNNRDERMIDHSVYLSPFGDVNDLPYSPLPYSNIYPAKTTELNLIQKYRMNGRKKQYSVDDSYDPAILYAFNVLLSALKLEADRPELGLQSIQKFPFVSLNIPRHVYQKIAFFMNTYFNAEKFEVWKEIQALINNIQGSMNTNSWEYNHLPNHNDGKFRQNESTFPNWADVFHVVLNET